jgi:hypothetical protein
VKQRFDDGASFRHLQLEARNTQNAPGLTATEWSSIIDGKSNLFDDFSPNRIYNSLFCQGGIEDK